MTGQHQEMRREFFSLKFLLQEFILLISICELSETSLSLTHLELKLFNDNHSIQQI